MDRRKDMKKLIFAFRNFAEASEKRLGLQYRSANLFIAAASFLSVCLSVTITISDYQTAKKQRNVASHKFG
jgi:hypothetical protein